MKKQKNSSKKTDEEAKEFFKEKKGSITDEEIKELLEVKNQYILSDEQMKYVFDNIGTKPRKLTSVLSEVTTGYSLEESVSYILSWAKNDLTHFKLQKILKALKEHPEGISTDYFDNQYENGVKLSNPKQVSEIMKLDYNPIIYRKDTRKYHLLSTTHKTALKSYNPQIK